jgi:hypothetical protein
MISEIRKSYRNDVIIIMGDWSRHNMRNMTSCPGISIKKKIKTIFSFIFDRRISYILPSLPYGKNT